ncbi:hypothetical protein A3C98_00855 [Candidatus Roizmanbacteria bacterium RIFCSPHIGHO2_02_FULL_37_15]|uniref:Uncharacterized protein n=1 Tax=Candidatus Roizmanbacteria bacterium RIFCSPLOWO2_01_FULL_37_16 TaxID=1802058 RepID=A0A1F7IMP3_9BACT|nr:MAG: hypothetical protein A2859_03850 [Candidatus Roizmanbacteria bacterium RIFCSPHIGHO2_01_FULL_37_16b]OGK21373.1 MAG: hypothetical protein A3C98_00855 [Candidatus Roizmanbacteria bacterium RIFCSPHIGHO2_02_FULL_37_15]OGK33891.1 MAG: hypothetical protein A3F57_06245 [Candidatus Roizmanbacteria bacterium RIFCSPHIGHO2_12_FULL_36_11]OGK44641.1 MAG: hypothetical protein A3B40_02860 [Candidatus Roizmanbacteria bacterium RIFCSPLOWO2_01_FULL_37_16]OGK56699.1 MAG: hypothetical protein A3I50_01435 [C
MEKAYRNNCYRCGRERIVVKVWKEKVENSVIENTESICPDKKCQEVVDQEIRRQRNKHLQAENKRKEMLRNRKIQLQIKTVRG